MVIDEIPVDPCVNLLYKLVLTKSLVHEDTAIFGLLLILLVDFDEVLSDVFDSFIGKLKLILVLC